MNGLKHPKIKPLPELLSELDGLRRAGKKLVFTNGCFDILHPGHVDLLARARALGDVLILGINSDGSVRRQGKNGDRPFSPCGDRAFVLAHLASVQYVVAFDEDTPLKLIEAIRPHVLVKGGDWEPGAIVGRECVEAAGGAVHSLPLIPGYSTTALAERIARSMRAL